MVAGVKIRLTVYTFAMTPFDIGFIIIVIIFSLVIHELMHGVAADWLGDHTARYEGRLTLNPLKHMDLLGSVIVPILTALAGSFFGWAKPVPYNPYNFRKHLRWAEAIVSFAGPGSNLAIALVAGLALRVGVSEALFPLVFYVVAINVSLFLLNMLPIPPLDGSKILASLLPPSLAYRYDSFRAVIEQNALIGFMLIFLLINLFSGAYGSAVMSIASVIAGV